MNLFQKIVEVRKVAGGFTKDAHSYGYSYVSGNQILSKIKDKMNELNLVLLPSTQVGEHHTHAYKTAKGKDTIDFVVKGEMAYTWINGDEPSERETVSWAYYGQQDDISKAYGSALTFSERYFLLKCLGLNTDEDDPDAKPEKTFQPPATVAQSSNSKPSTNAKPEAKNAPAASVDGEKATTGQANMLKLRLKDAGCSLERLTDHFGYTISTTADILKKDVNPALTFIAEYKAKLAAS
jgi:hypothetical protein